MTLGRRRVSKLSEELKGKEFGPFVYIVWRKKVEDFIEATGDENPVYLDDEAAREAGYDGKLVPISFASATGSVALWSVIGALGVDLSRLLHGGHEFEFIKPLRDADFLTTTLRVADIVDKKKLRLYILEGKTVNAAGEEVLRFKTTLIERRG